MEPLLILSFVSGVCSVICFQKGKPGLGSIGLVGLIPPLAPVLVWFPIVGAFRYAKPGSSWAQHRYGEHQLRGARLRFPRLESIDAPVEQGSPPSTPTETEAMDDLPDRSAISQFLYDAWAKGIIDEDTHQRLRDLLDVKPPTPPQEPLPSRQPAVVPEPAAIPPSHPQPTPLIPAVESARPAPSEPALPPASPPPPPAHPMPPPAPPKPSPVTTMLSQLWDAIASDVALHGFAYLGVLLTFIGVLGFLLFAFADIADAAQPFVELFIALIFFGWAWVLRKQDAVHVADGMELIGGMVLPLILFAGLVDNAPFPPDFQGGALVVALAVTTVLLAASYTWFTARNTDSTLRYLAAPVLWLGAITVGFVFKTDEALVSDAITRLVSAQPALASAAIALTLAACRRRPDHRLSLPSVRAAMVGLPVAYLLTVSLSVGEDWVRTWPIVLLGGSAFISGEILTAWYEKRSWNVWMRPLLLAGVLGPLAPTLGVGWSGLVVALAYLVLFEETYRASPQPLHSLLLPTIGVLAGASMSLAEPWSALIVYTALSSWAHLRRTDSWPSKQVEQMFLAAASFFPVGIGYALVQILEPGVAWMVMAGILTAATFVIRWRRNDDIFWPYWLTGASLLVALGAVSAWNQSGQTDVFAVSAVLATAITVGLAPRWPIPRLWAAAGLLSVGFALFVETAGLRFDQRIILWSGFGLGAVVAATAVRRSPASHLAAIGHIIGTVTILVRPTGTAWAVALGAWSLGWIGSVLAQELGGDSFTRLLTRVSFLAGLARDDRPSIVVGWIAPVLMVSSLPPAVITIANLSQTFTANRSWSGLLMATIALAYALAARLAIRRIPLSTVVSLAAVASSITGAAVAAPDSWPTIYASAAVIAVATLLSRDLRRTWFVWFAWLMSVVMILLLGERAGVPANSLHLVSLTWGGVMMIGGLVLDDVLTTRRTPGEGLRIAWLRHPVLLGALLTPVSLGPVFTNPPEVYGWWALGLGAAYFGVAYLIRTGAVTAPALGLLVVGLTALSPRSLLDEPWLFIFIAAPMVGISWIAERLQSEEVASDGWLRWDLGPLVVAHLVGGFALVMAIGNGDVFSSALAFGLLALAIGVWRRHRAWIDVGNLLILISTLEAATGWLALALTGTALRGALGAWLADGWNRVSYHLIGVVSAGLAWIAFIDWRGLSAMDAVNYSALVFGGLGLAMSILVRWWSLRVDTVTAWGGLAVTGLLVSGLIAAGPDGSGVQGPSLAIGFLLFAAALEIAAGKVQTSLRFFSVAAAGIAWIAMASGLSWSRPDTITYSALVFGFVALVTAIVSRRWSLQRVDIVRWGGLGTVGVVVAGLGSADELGAEALERPWVALGILMLAASFELAWKTVDPALRYFAVATAGVSWLALIPATGWSRSLAVGTTAVVFGALMVFVVEWTRLRPIRRYDDVEPAASGLNVARAWAGLGALGVLGSSIFAERTGELEGAGFWVAGGLALLAVGAARAAQPLEAGWPRESSAVAALISLTRFARAAGFPDASFAVGIVVLAAVATLGSLALWRRRPDSIWIRPIFFLAAVSNLEAIAFALTAWPQRALLVVVLLSTGVQSIAVGLTRNAAGIAAIGPPMVGLAFVLAVAESVSGTAQWYTVPVALVLLSEVEILRKMRRDTGRKLDSADALVLEWAGIGLLAAPSLVEMFTIGLGYGLVAFGITVVILLWAIVTQVRRRAIASASLAVTAAVLLIFAAAAGSAPASAFFWIVAAGVGFAVMLVAALVEAYRSRKGQTMVRLSRLMEGWE